ncbi:TetR family transcriptional regulator [Capsulimonas corticalis]|uniref:TetR family transcriptional regulator n=1 Tax=Capsulimonas corticalis TaxID=2219043 RepID=A0A402CTD3_9BACT|nr:TetR/AcrR family transcriptional regulator [Capsulimonas corticalis]BDI30756.1 TetR family transcriptional regulator [Capsulimonas corticalis]
MKNKTLGRPRTFDAGQVLDQAVQVFWTKGYDAASVDDLVLAMGMSKPSLYNAFGDKQALFMRCLERYGETVGARALGAMSNAEGARDAAHAYLAQAARNATGDDTPAGCLIACIAPVVDHAGVRAFLATAITAADEAIADRLAAGVASGELPADFPARQRARRITDLSMSIALRARVGATRAELLVAAAEGAELALGPC